MIPHNRNLFVIIVHFGAWATTERLLFGLTQCQKPPETIVVVNQDTTPIPERGIQNTYYVQHPHNGGYAAGVNVGVEEARNIGLKKKDIVVILNNDMEVNGQVCEKIRAWWSSVDSHVLAGPWLGSVNLYNGRAMIGRAAKSWGQLTYIHGACISARAATIERMGPMPERYGMYWEDVAWSADAAQKGVKIRNMGDIGLAHDDRGSQHSAQKTYYQVRNGAYWLERYTPARWRWYWRIRNAIRRVYHCLARSSSSSMVCRALADARAGVLRYTQL